MVFAFTRQGNKAPCISTRELIAFVREQASLAWIAGCPQFGVHPAQKIRAESSSNARKLRSAGFTPQKIRAELSIKCLYSEVAGCRDDPAQKSAPCSYEMVS